MHKKRHTAAAQTRLVKEYIETKLDGELLEHTLGCVEMARRLAGRFKVDSEKVAVASYLHDLAKSIARKEQAAVARSMGMSEAFLLPFHRPLRAHLP